MIHGHHDVTAHSQVKLEAGNTYVRCDCTEEGEEILTVKSEMFQAQIYSMFSNTV